MGDRRQSSMVSAPRQVACAEFPSRWGSFKIFGFERDGDIGTFHREEAVVLIMGDVKTSAPLVRIHSQCFTGDVLGSLRCDCGRQLRSALSMIRAAGSGILIYEAKEGRGIGLMAKLLAYELQDQGMDTVEANQALGFKSDYRDFIVATEILKYFGICRIRLISNNPEKIRAVEESGIIVVERVPCEVTPSFEAVSYLRTKKSKMGHLLTLV